MADNLTFASDSEKYDEARSTLPEIKKDNHGRSKMVRSNTMTGTKKSTTSSKWGYGWGVGKKQKEKEKDLALGMDSNEKVSMTSQTDLPLYHSPEGPQRSNSKSTQASRSTQRTQESHRTQATQKTQ